MGLFSGVEADDTVTQGEKVMDVLSIVCALLLCTITVHSKPTIKKDRVLYQDPEITRQAYDDNKSFQYDHEAFLGKEEAKTFDQLTPEESKERLR